MNERLQPQLERQADRSAVCGPTHWQDDGFHGDGQVLQMTHTWDMHLSANMRCASASLLKACPAAEHTWGALTGGRMTVKWVILTWATRQRDDSEDAVAGWEVKRKDRWGGGVRLKAHVCASQTAGVTGKLWCPQAPSGRELTLAKALETLWEELARQIANSIK